MYTFSTSDPEREGTVPLSPRSRRRQIEEGEPPVNHRSRLPLWLAIAALAAAITGGAWYAYPRLSAYDSQLTGASGLPSAVRTVGARVGEAERRLGDLTAQIGSAQQLAASVTRRVQAQVAAGLQQARDGTRDLGIALRREMQEAIGAQEKTVTARFSELEARRQAETARAARLEHEVAQLSQRLAAVTDEVNNVRTAGVQDSQQLREQLRATDTRVERVASFNNRPRERFEISRGRTQQIAPGIFLHINRIDSRFRRYHGWLQLVDDGKILWLRDRSVLQTVAFHAGKGTLRHDLIVTAMTEGGAAGYLILPSRGESGTAASTVAGAQ